VGNPAALPRRTAGAAVERPAVTKGGAGHRLRQLLARPAYRRLWLARTISQVGDVAQFTTLALLLIALTGSGLGVSGAVLAEIAPVLLLAPLAGSLVDRLPRVRVMVAADLARLLLAAVLSVWHEDVAVAYAVAFGLSAGQVFFGPAAQSLLPAAVEDDELVEANSYIWTAAVTAQVLVAPVAALVAVRVAIGLGAAIGPLLLLKRIKNPRRLLFVFGPYAARGLVDLVLAAVTALPLAAAALVVYGLSTSTGNVTFSSLVQSRVPDELRGRAFAGFDMLWQAGRMLSLLGGGLLADAVGIRAVYLLGGLLLLAAAAVGAAGAHAAGKND